jgi:cytochrome c-type biogenesis protein
VVFLNGAWYALGRIVCYSALGIIIYFGASKFHIAQILQHYGDKIIGPLLLFIGIILLDIIPIRLPDFNLTSKTRNVSSKGAGAFSLGFIFSLAFCPVSAMLFFGMLIPLTVSSAGNLYLPLVFAVASSIPIIISAWIIAFSFSKIGSVYNRIKTIEKYVRIISAALFIVAGIYFCYIFYL